jgi:hypothetical protein
LDLIKKDNAPPLLQNQLYQVKFVAILRFSSRFLTVVGWTSGVLALGPGCPRAGARNKLLVGLNSCM